MSEVKEVKTEVSVEEARQKQLEALANLFKSECTGQIEPWQGLRGPMFNAFLKNDGLTPSPVKGAETIKELAEIVLKSLKGSSYFIRFKFQVPDGSGGKTEQNATLVSVAKQGYLVFAGRERRSVSFTTSVDKIERKAKLEGMENVDESGKMDIDWNMFGGTNAKGAGIDII